MFLEAGLDLRGGRWAGRCQCVDPFVVDKIGLVVGAADNQERQGQQ